MSDAPITDPAPSFDLQRVRRSKLNLVDPAKVDRQPPHSVEAEQGCLGCVLLSPQECFTILAEKFSMGSDVFYDLRNRLIYETMLWLYERNRLADIVVVLQTIRDFERLEAVGGPAYVAALPDAVPSAANLEYYVDIVLEKWTLRRAIGVCQEGIRMAYEMSGEVNTYLDTLEHDILAIGKQAEDFNNPTTKTAKSLVQCAVETIQDLRQNQGQIPGIATGFFDFDRMTMGLHRGEVAIIAARPSTGKSSLAMNIADHVGVVLNEPVGVFSLEMTAESLMLRMMCSRARVNLRHVSSGTCVDNDYTRLHDASIALLNAPIYVDDARGLTILHLRAKARRLHQQHGIKLFIIDYLQLLRSSNHRASNREQEVADISNGIHNIAGELSVPVLVLAQLNREVERRGPGAKPRLSELRESGAIEQDADLVGLLYKRDQIQDDNSDYTAEAVAVNLLIAKQRNGPTGEVPLLFWKTYTRFDSVTNVSVTEVQI